MQHKYDENRKNADVAHCVSITVLVTSWPIDRMIFKFYITNIDFARKHCHFYKTNKHTNKQMKNLTNLSQTTWRGNISPFIRS